MENQTCLVEEYIAQQPSTIEMTVKRIKNIKYAEKIKNATNDVYLMKGLHEDMIVVFKLIQEETIYNAGKKKGYKTDREVAAFILDHPILEGGERFRRVSRTSFACVIYIKGKTTDWFDIDDVQRLSLIDMRFGNYDRHSGNILNSNTNGGKLIPIDHGECFLTEWNNYIFIWTTWVQAAIPYPCYMVDYVKSLDMKDDPILK
ncbi:hypothetical protein N665_0058s0045 [Sinapis alba]|nr:hypothetical protein N665_0058s0045 [Sinapis alba]